MKIYLFALSLLTVTGSLYCAQYNEKSISSDERSESEKQFYKALTEFKTAQWALPALHTKHEEYKKNPDSQLEKDIDERLGELQKTLEGPICKDKLEQLFQTKVRDPKKPSAFSSPVTQLKIGELRSQVLAKQLIEEYLIPLAEKSEQNDSASSSQALQARLSKVDKTVVSRLIELVKVNQQPKAYQILLGALTQLPGAQPLSDATTPECKKAKN